MIAPAAANFFAQPTLSHETFRSWGRLPSGVQFPLEGSYQWMGEKELEWQLDILVAEDTPSDVELFEIALKKCGNVRSLQIVRDGQEVTDYLQGYHPSAHNRREAPNVIFMDLKMPRMTGFEVLKWLRSHPECSVIPVIVMSSSALESDVLQAYRLGANAFFEKPANFEQLQSIIRSILTFWSHAKRPPVNKFPC